MESKDQAIVEVFYVKSLYVNDREKFWAKIQELEGNY